MKTGTGMCGLRRLDVQPMFAVLVSHATGISHAAADVTQSAAAWEMPVACETNTANMGWTSNLLNPHIPVPVFIYPAGVGRPTACTPNYVAGPDGTVVRPSH